MLQTEVVGKDFVLVDLRRTDHEVIFHREHLPNNVGAPHLRRVLILGRYHSWFYQSPGADHVPQHVHVVLTIQ